MDTKGGEMGHFSVDDFRLHNVVTRIYLVRDEGLTLRRVGLGKLHACTTYYEDNAMLYPVDPSHVTALE